MSRLVAGAIIALSLSLAQLSGVAAQGVNKRVKLTQATSVFVTQQRKALSIRYEYSFPDRESIHISALGIVPAKGTFAYITEDPELIFSDQSSKTPLATLALKETAAVAAKPPLNRIPNDEEFDPAIRTFRWTSKDSLQQKANAILGMYVSFRPREVGGISQFTT